MEGVVFCFVLFLGVVFGDTPSNELRQQCLSNDGPFPVYLPHPTNCNLFYECSNGNKILMSCPPDLHFNPNINVCDYPQNAGCNASKAGKLSVGKANSLAKLLMEKAKEKRESLKDTQCPAVDGAVPVYLPHSTDCSKFFECSNGEKILLECAPGLHFNPNKNVCDWPGAAGCVVNKETNHQVRKSKTKSAIGKECPAVNGAFPVYLPHSSDCTKFYECSNGEKILLECANGLHFNPNKNVCDWPEVAGCKANKKTSIHMKKSVTKIDIRKKTECPAVDGAFPVYLPHSTDCSKFYECSNGDKILLECVPGLHFNPNKNVCDWPEAAGCGANLLAKLQKVLKH